MDVLQRLVTQNEAALDAHRPCSAANGKWKCGLRNQTETKNMPCTPVNRCKRDLVG
jgi:hypothetical protein